MEIVAMRFNVITAALFLVLSLPVMAANYARDTFVAFGVGDFAAASLHQGSDTVIMPSGQRDFPFVVVVRVRCGTTNAPFSTCMPSVWVPGSSDAFGAGAFPSLAGALEAYYHALYSKKYSGIWLVTFSDQVTALVYRRK